jgi:hypothetical protein
MVWPNNLGVFDELTILGIRAGLWASLGVLTLQACLVNFELGRPVFLFIAP